jgi:prolipoprotein diacylglyceryltransferase
METYIPFGWFYLFNLIGLATFLLFYGLKKEYPLSTWITLIAWVMAFFLIGLKLMNFPVSDWRQILSSTSDEPVYNKFVPGGALFFLFGLLTIRLLLRFRGQVLDGLILILPLLLAVQRIGCFLNGCCYGKPTDLPWAIHYHPGEALSMGIHPVQLYHVAGAIMVFLILWRCRNAWKSAGGGVLFGMILLMVLRFTIEFFRHNDAWKWYAGVWLGLNYLQWIILGLLIPMITILVARERQPAKPIRIIPYSESLPRNAVALLILITLIWNTNRIFEFQELIFLVGIMTMAVVINIVRIISTIIEPAIRYGTVLLLMVAFGTMSQDIIRSETDSIKKDSAKFWVTLGLNGSAGQYEERVRNCSGDITSRTDKAQTSGNLNATLHYQPNQRHLLDFGINAWVVSDKYLEDPYGKTIYRGVYPYFGYNLIARNQNWLGVNMGVFYSNPSLIEGESKFYPALYLRVGPKEVFFADIGIYNELMMTGKPSLFQMGLGIGSKKIPQSNFRFGVSFGQLNNWNSDDDFHLYLAGDFKVGDKFTFKPSVYILNEVFGTVGLGYRFGN